MKLVLVAGDDPCLTGLASVEGPFLVVANGVTFTRRAQLDATGKAGKATEGAVVHLSIFADPGVYYRGAPNAAGAWGDKTEESLYLWTFNAPAAVKPGQRTLDYTATFKDILAEEESATWEVADVLKAQPERKEFGESVVDFAGAGQLRSGYVFPVKVAWGGLAERVDFGWPARSWLDRLRAVWLVDAKGNLFYPGRWDESRGFSFTPSAGLLAADAQPLKLVVRVPKRLVEVQIPVSFRALALPR